MGYVDRLLAPGERIRYRTRRHGLVLVRAVFGALVLVVLAVAAALLLGRATPDPEVGLYAVAARWGAVALAVLGLLLGLPAWLRWRSEEYLVTDRRVLQVEGVFGKRVLDSSLEKVNDVRLTQSWIGRLLGYGTVEILTASEGAVNRLDMLPRPLAFKRAMLDAKSGAPGMGAPGEGAPLPRPAGGGEVAARLAQLEELRREGLLSEDEYQAKRAAILERL
jgi:uncharacterized membrane protein YdbT with pleckstrin-like domain